MDLAVTTVTPEPSEDAWRARIQAWWCVGTCGEKARDDVGTLAVTYGERLRPHFFSQRRSRARPRAARALRARTHAQCHPDPPRSRRCGRQARPPRRRQWPWLLPAPGRAVAPSAGGAGGFPRKGPRRRRRRRRRRRAAVRGEPLARSQQWRQAWPGRAWSWVLRWGVRVRYVSFWLFDGRGLVASCVGAPHWSEHFGGTSAPGFFSHCPDPDPHTWARPPRCRLPGR